MYPIIRILKENHQQGRAAPLGFFDTHVSTHRCWPQDIDIYMEMNNGRILTIFDIARTGLARRVGLLDTLSKNKWGLTMAGVSVRYRKRIRPFVKFQTASRLLSFDEKFMYLDQTIWLNGECATQCMYRSAVTAKGRLMDPAILARAMGFNAAPPPLPDWVNNWIAADATRPWPPALSDDAQALITAPQK